MTTGRNGRDALSDLQVSRCKQSSFPFGGDTDLAGRVQDLESMGFVAEPEKFSFGYVRFTGNVANAETITVNGRVYEFDTAAAPGSVVAGHVRVDVSGGVADTQAATALAAAVNADGGAVVDAVVASTVVALVGRYQRTAFTLAKATANAVVSGATMLGGAAAADLLVSKIRHSITVENVAALLADKEIPVGMVLDHGTTPDVLFLQCSDSSNNFYSSMNLELRLAQVNSSHWVALLKDPGHFLASTDIVRGLVG